ncbi:(2Fe-2S)-binding protein [Acetobacteraceae bacterium ESL0709]|nr:(2Fe-2S)-binding protein [Acetobacteraceae bacterium ESL0697]MDF7678173.1 (2Fe-2S)-binding protein [Acetobacteraceae bacterium ESL0709]
MIICSCNGLSDRDITAVIDDGASRLTDLYARKNCQVRCGNCLKNVKCLFREELQKRRASMSSAPVELYPLQPHDRAAACIVHQEVS